LGSLAVRSLKKINSAEMRLVRVHRAILNLPGEDMYALRLLPAKNIELKEIFLGGLSTLIFTSCKAFSGHFSPAFGSHNFFLITNQGGVYC